MPHVMSRLPILLMDMLEETGLQAMVGKVNMDRNATDYLCEDSPGKSVEDTLQWLREVKGKYRENTKTNPYPPVYSKLFGPSDGNAV